MTAETPLPTSAEWRETQIELTDAPARSVAPATARVVRWPSEGSLTFQRAALLDNLGRERAIFEAGGPFSIRLELEAHRSGRFNLVLGASVYRLDGVFVTNLVSPAMPLDLSDGERVEAWLEMPRLPLGDARYVVSFSAFEGQVLEHTRYDLIARAAEFQVTGNPPLVAGTIVQLDAHWRIGAEAATAGGRR